MSFRARAVPAAFLLAIGLLLSAAPELIAQTEIMACYNDRTGVLYVIDPTGASDLPTACVNPNHLTLSFVDAAGADHGALTGLGDDDHPQYLPVDGSRGMSGNLTTTAQIGIGTSPSSPLTIQPALGADIQFAPGGGFNADILANNEFRVGTLNTLPFHLLTDNRFRLSVAGNGNVGIGTTSPAEKLSVDGIVETTAGIKFGDGTVQTTASAGHSHSVVHRSIAISMPAFRLSFGHVDCEPGELATGGGISMTDDPNLNLWRNQPSGNGWRVGVSNYGSADRTGTIYVVCLQAS